MRRFARATSDNLFDRHRQSRNERGDWESTMTAILGRWWRADQYDWLSGYLAARGISGATRALMASIAASMVLCLIALLAGSDGPRGPVPVAMMWIAAGGGARPHPVNTSRFSRN